MFLYNSNLKLHNKLMQQMDAAGLTFIGLNT